MSSRHAVPRSKSKETVKPSREPETDPYQHLSKTDKALVDSLNDHLNALEKTVIDINNAAVLEKHFSILLFLSQNNIELNISSERCEVLTALWVEFFKYLERSGRLVFKYNSLVEFMRAYPRFEDHSEEDKLILMRTANWIAM